MKIKLVEEAIALDEPVEELPPVEVQDIEISEPEVDDSIKENAMSSIIANEISNTYASIDAIKSIIATMSSEMPEKEDVIAILNQLIDDKTLSVGMLQKAMDLIDGKTSDLIDSGVEVADDIAHNEGEEENEQMKVKVVNRKLKEEFDLNDCILKVLKLIGQAHDKIMEAQDELSYAKDEADEEDNDYSEVDLIDSLEYSLDDLESTLSEYDFMGEDDPVQAFIDKEE